MYPACVSGALRFSFLVKVIKSTLVCVPGALSFCFLVKVINVLFVLGALQVSISS